MEKVKCPICEFNAHLVDEKDHGLLKFFECDLCGNFCLTGETIDDINLDDYKNSRPILSYWIRNHQRNTPRLTRELLINILKSTSLPKPKEQADNFISLIGNSVTSPDQAYKNCYFKVAPFIGAVNSSNVIYILKHLLNYGFVNAQPDSGDDFECSLTFAGWNKYDELQKLDNQSRVAFMAMKFGNKTLDRIFNNVIKEAVRETGFEIRKLDEEKRAGSIDDKLRVEIRRSKFLIADLTHDNNGAYWEAGYAEGLGLPVIYICDKNKFNKKTTHFDTNHHLTVLWEDDQTTLNEFAEELKNTIRATLPFDSNLDY